MEKVFVEYDGCLDDRPLFEGSHDLCLWYLRKHWRKYNKGNQTLALIDQNGRHLSFIL